MTLFRNRVFIDVTAKLEEGHSQVGRDLIQFSLKLAREE
jgi:hypothetical protein